MMGTGEAEGERRAVDAAEAAISNPLLEDVSMKGARGVLINITGGLDMTLFEVDEAANRVREEVDPNANIIFGSTFDEKLQGRMRISVVATGIDGDNPQGERAPTLGSRMPEPAPATRGGYTQPMLTQNAVPSAPRAAAAPTPAAEPAPPAAEAAESAAVRSGAFIAPKPVDPGTPRQVPLAHPAVPPAADAPARPRGRGPSLIERVTGVGRVRMTQPAVAPAPAAAPVAPPAPPPPPAAARPMVPPAAAGARSTQQRLGPLEPEERSGNSKEDDLLDIPAFLRRQAN
jgi:cell division protein FtsZ